MAREDSEEETMHLGTVDTINVNGGLSARQAVAGRFSYRGPTVVDNRLATPPAATPRQAGSPTLLTGSDVPGQIAGRAVLDALQPLLGPAPAASPPAAFSGTGKGAADQVLGALGQALGAARRQGATPAQLQDLTRQARAGVAQGLDEARQALSGLGLATPAVATQVDETQSGLEQGLAALEAQFAAPALAGEQALQVASGSSQRLALEVTTRDGDTVRLTLARSQGQYQGAIQRSSGGSTTTVVQGARYASANFSLSVEGQLDAGELEAIQGLMKKVDKLADKFFEGEVQAAFGKALEMHLDAEELVSFTLDLALTRQRQVSSSYQSIDALAAPLPEPAASPSLPPAPAVAAAAPPASSAPPSTLADALDTLGGLFQEMRSVMELPTVKAVFDKPSDVFRQLLGGAAELHPAHDEAAARLGQAAEITPRALLDKIGVALAGGEEAEGDAERHGEEEQGREDDAH